MNTYIIDCANIINVGFECDDSDQYDECSEYVLKNLNLILNNQMFNNVEKQFIYVYKSKDYTNEERNEKVIKRLERISSFMNNSTIHYISRNTFDKKVPMKRNEKERDDFHCLHLAQMFENSTIISSDLMRNRKYFQKNIPSYKTVIIKDGQKIDETDLNPSKIMITDIYKNIRNNVNLAKMLIKAL
jgi:hypothetical protein